MGKLEQAISELQQMQSGGGRTDLNPLCMLLVTLAYLVAMLSVPAGSLTMLLWFALYPIAASPAAGLDFTRIFLRSLVVLPFVVIIGIFNPIFDKVPALTVGGIVISHGWITFISIVVRGLLSVQALLLLTDSCGFIGMCRSLGRLGVPDFLTVQLMMVYRYLTVLLQEGLDMRRAREARGYGRHHMPIRMWGSFVGQLFLRTMNRADNIHRAMLARGFNGRIPRYAPLREPWRMRDTIILIGAVGLFLFLRFADISSLLGFK